MNARVVISMTGRLLLVLAALLLAPAAMAWWDEDSTGLVSFLFTAGVSGAIGLMLRRAGSGAAESIHRKDAFGIVALSWAGLGLLGALPFLLSGAIPDPAGAVFEAVSGFTTTGATVVADVDGLSRAVNLWRCQMHWIGGMGIVVLFVAVFPLLGVGAKQLFRTEVPGPITEGLRPRIKETALVLWWIYASATLGCGLLLWGFGMSPFDAACHAMSTLGTGGFSTRTASLGAWDSPAIHWTVAFFMLAAGMNFALYYAAARGSWRVLYRDAELRFYLGMNLLVIGVVFLAILPRHGVLEETLRHAAFQVLAVTTTTGFMTEDFDTYGDLSRFLLLLCMFVGACAGSTAGGLKVSRFLLLLKLGRRALQNEVQPQGVFPVRLGARAVPDRVLHAVLVFAATFLGLFVVASILLLAMGVDMLTAMSASVACLSSIGPGLDGVGPSQNYGFMPGAAKMVLSFCMIAGRLELFALFAVFHPACWRKG